ncbi:MAG TPA: ABC transporter ATP-binding protein [Actinomycetota bacterium]|nr:ABC transporter ATP-binding protein [Actinomycetota bacterium]
MSDYLLELRDVSTGFGANTVLHGCSYHVSKGEIAGVLGLNGAGKSVSLKVVAGLLPAWSGQVFFLGEDVTKMSVEERVARGMGHVPQGRQVFPDFTVEENLRLGAYTLRRRDKSRYKSVLDGLLERFPILAERRDQLAGTMSGGQQAMLAVARGLMSEPKLLVIDEPSAGLSPVAVQELFETLKVVHETGVTILLVEQNVTFSLKVADRVHIMQRGQIVYEGIVGNLDTDKVADYLGVGRLLSKSLKASAPEPVVTR